MLIPKFYKGESGGRVEASGIPRQLVAKSPQRYDYSHAANPKGPRSEFGLSHAKPRSYEQRATLDGYRSFDLCRHFLRSYQLLLLASDLLVSIFDQKSRVLRQDGNVLGHC